ncbi:MAG: hypothetical protein IH846_14620 [Acidobacteria bacterium]|nr:hypothetical protein [Acidobacteriota bacterium]
MIARRLLLLGTASMFFMGTGWALQGHDVNFDYSPIPFDHKAIQYLERPADDPAAHLQRQMDQGEAKLEFDPQRGYLPSLLEHLGINVDSQVLVFSKTSTQASRISPARPRAIYFNDSVSIGFVQNSQVLEVAALDPTQGMVFYTLANRPSGAPSFSRQVMSCLQCHMGPATLNVPGLVVSSTVPRPDGSPSTRAFATDHRIPLEDRWGGWYVSGTLGGIAHRGVAIAGNTGAGRSEGQNPAGWGEPFNKSAYLSPSSDIVALMTLEHQTRMTNLILRIGWEARVAAEDGKREEFRQRLDFLVDEIVTYMLFADEAPIPKRIEGDSTFTETFSQRGPRDAQGRSLRDFDLQERLFRYPLSYMVYSEAFDSIPDIAREEVLRALYDVLTGVPTGVLTGKDASPKFAHLSVEDRRAVLEILRDTKPQLPAYWKSSPGVQ